MHAQSLSPSQLLVTLWTVTQQARDFPGKNTGVGCHCLPQGIFPTQGSNPHLLHCRQIFFFYHWATKEALYSLLSHLITSKNLISYSDIIIGSHIVVRILQREPVYPFSHSLLMVALGKITVEFHAQIVTIGIVIELTFEKCQCFKTQRSIMANKERRFSFFTHSCLTLFPV